ncbi:hypothetical protein B0H11DRAFT_2005199 [Mycena galericulata]|nr:hypothetical protein B0H11DRAFT_2005199 [Mycena galericulata]
MKRTRFYNALPRVAGGRVRSNSASRALYTSSTPTSFFDAPPPPPNTRNGPMLTTNRLPIEGRGEGEAPHGGPNASHAPLALAAPHPPSAQLAPAGQLALLGLFPSGVPGPPHLSAPAPSAAGGRARGRRGARYTLEVGAYGIPKRHHHQQQRASYATDAPLAVQVGEDAYFIRENAMGVADGVGGWARVKTQAPAPPPTSPSASALFARRLMHFCADEVDRAAHHARAVSGVRESERRVPVVAHWEPPARVRGGGGKAFAAYTAASASGCPPAFASAWQEPASSMAYAHPAHPSSPYSSYTHHASPYDDNEFEFDVYEQEREEHDGDPAAALAAHLDALADGIDVLSILERAYERTLGAHVVEVPGPVGVGADGAAATTSPPTPTTQARTQAQTTADGKPQEEPKTIPLLAGSSTALVAVLDYVPRGTVAVELAGATAGAAEGSTTQTPETEPTPGEGKATAGELTPVLKIAHVGDCMGMLVRGGAVAWRSEEMWWRWNTPVQLSAARASASASSRQVRGWWEGFVGTSTSGSSSPGGAATSASSSGASTTATPGRVAKDKAKEKEKDGGSPAALARLFTLPVQAGDVLILASDGLSDNLWDEDVLEEVGRVCAVFGVGGAVEVEGGGKGKDVEGGGKGKEAEGEGEGEGIRTEAVDGGCLRRRTLAGMLSEALCSRARRVATRRAGKERGRSCAATASSSSVPSAGSSSAASDEDEDETPFARRARETGRVYRGGKNDDISVIVAVIAPAHSHGAGALEAARAAGG